MALVDGIPKVLDLKGMLTQYVLHRKEVVRRRTEYELRKAKERAHILEGLKIAFHPQITRYLTYSYKRLCTLIAALYALANT